MDYHVDPFEYYLLILFNTNMELQALLTSNILPNDIVFHEIYKHLWRNKNLLNEAQTEAIVQDHFHLKKIIRAYFHCEQFSHEEYCGDYDIYFLDSLVADMLYFLNDNENYTWQGGLTSPSLEKRCPDLTENNSIISLSFLTMFQS
jgi:hypothetical protein